MDRAANILLVDDDPIFLAVAETIIGTVGKYQVATAANGADGLEAVGNAAEPFNLIVLDLNMPRLDGLAFLRGAASLGFRGGVIISSGEAPAVLRSAQMMGEMLGIRVLGALKKPLSAPDLVALITQAEEVPTDVRQPPQRILPSCSFDTLELVPFYQTQHDARDGSICGLEALIRAKAPDGQIHGPGKLFGLIHEHAELVQTTLAIAAKVMDDMRAWNAEGICCRTSINLDARVAEDAQVVPALIALAQERGLNPELICLELTETALPKDMTRLMEALARLRIAGFALSLDDYGTGGSNFELLRLCPFTELKLDGSVIRAAATESIAARFIDATVAMARELGIEVVAEGIETEAQLDLVCRARVGIIQGYLFSVPVEDIRRLLLSRQPQRRIG